MLWSVPQDYCFFICMSIFTCNAVEPVIDQVGRGWWAHVGCFLESFGTSLILVARMQWRMLEFPHIVRQLSNTATRHSVDNTVVQTEAHTLNAHTHATKSANLRVWIDTHIRFVPTCFNYAVSRHAACLLCWNVLVLPSKITPKQQTFCQVISYRYKSNRIIKF